MGEDLRYARLVARRTWRFFETFVGAEDNWLPPDNFQEDPKPVIAHRTSPTNIGMLMLSTLAAHDFGYISTLEFVERQELTFASLTELGKLRGHCFNWYDTRTLEPLMPQYISTVDSGNLAGHLIALKQAFIEMPEVRFLDQRVIEGLTDTILAISEEAGRLGTVRQRTEVVTVRHLRDEIEACKELLTSDANRSSWSWFFSSTHSTSTVRKLPTLWRPYQSSTALRASRTCVGGWQPSGSRCGHTVVMW